MKTEQAKVGDIIYHEDLNSLVCCRDKFFNHCLWDEHHQEHLSNPFRYYTVDNSGPFHTSSCKLNNTWEKFTVISARYGGGGGGTFGNDWPNAWQVLCSPIDNDNIVIAFNQMSTSFAHTIDEVIKFDNITEI
jgi:hypothetical protein